MAVNLKTAKALGLTIIANELMPKRLGLLHELLPQSARLGLLIDPKNPSLEATVAIVQAAERRLGGELEILYASDIREIDKAVTDFARKQGKALLVGPSPLFLSRRIQLATLSSRYEIAAIFPQREYAEAGGLMSYGGSYTEEYRLVGVYTGRVLKGEKPADLPVMQPTKFELVINIKTAKALGLTIPETLLATADEVIQ